MWALGVVVGRGAVTAVAAKHIPGVSSSARIQYYVDKPVLALVILLAAAILFNFVARFPAGLIGVSLVALFVFLWWFAMSGGGI